jgi:creatinine amidohydrolase
MGKGTITVSSELMQRMLTELCAEIARNGFKKILFLNGHGGNAGVLANFMRSTAHEKKDYVVMKRNEFQYSHNALLRDIEAGEEFPELLPEDVDYIREAVEQKHSCGHGGIMETSIMNVINPESVNMSRCNADDGTSRRRTRDFSQKGIGIENALFWITDYPDSLAGEKLERANARIGKALLRKRIALQAEACRLLKQDDRVLEWNDEHNAKF